MCSGMHPLAKNRELSPTVEKTVPLQTNQKLGFPELMKLENHLLGGFLKSN